MSSATEKQYHTQGSCTCTIDNIQMVKLTDKWNRMELTDKKLKNKGNVKVEREKKLLICLKFNSQHHTGLSAAI